MDVRPYFSTETWKRIKTLADTKETPFLIVDLATIEAKYLELTQAFPQAKIYYAVKANPAVEVISLLARLGAHFDIASVYELDRVLSLNVTPDRISYGNTIKKQRDIRYFYEKGVRLFVTDSETDLRNIAAEAPNSRVYVRILTEGALTADWPLSRKFGCQADLAVDLLKLAHQLGLEAYGLSFHVGSQQRDISAWDAAISKCTWIFERMDVDEGIPLKMMNLGGGFPAQYTKKVHDLQTYASEIHRYLNTAFDGKVPEIILEPGRSLVGDSGVLISEVVLISRKSRTGLHRWVYTDVGKFNGLIETMDESIKYPLLCEKSGSQEDVIIAGPTCDSMDILYEQHKYRLPLSLAIGDRLYWMTTGAYTSSYCSVEFNGFPPMKTYFV